jgi:hypothetical protein
LVIGSGWAGRVAGLSFVVRHDFSMVDKMVLSLVLVVGSDE